MRGEMGASRPRVTCAGLAIRTASKRSEECAVETVHCSPSRARAVTTVERRMRSGRSSEAMRSMSTWVPLSRLVKIECAASRLACDWKPRMSEPCSCSMRTKAGMTARTLSVATSPPKTPLSRGAATFARTSSPKCRWTKLAMLSSAFGASRRSSSARPGSAA